jgi:hypothetical protein
MADTNPSRRKKAPQKPEKVASEAIAKAAESAKDTPRKKTGRPSKYTQELAHEICERLADGEPLRQICRDDHMPAWQTIYDWMNRDDALGEAGVGLSVAIARAREMGQDAIAEEIYIETCLEPERILSEGGGRVDSGYVQLIKARADIKLKLLAKWNPKRYGDRVQLAGDAENPLKTQVDITLFDTLLTTLETRRQAKE